MKKSLKHDLVDHFMSESSDPEAKPAQVAKTWFYETVLGKMISDYLSFPFETKIFTDFDGTLTSEDTLQHLLNTFGDARWKEIEDEVTQGAMSERDALQAEIGTISVPKSEAIQRIQEKVSIDPYFARFVAWCNRKEIPLRILSGGFSSLIKPMLDLHCPFDLPIEANDFEVTKDGWKVIPHSGSRLCEMCNHCKTLHLVKAKAEKKKKALTIYIGDGNTDRCPAAFSDIVFAKGKLINYCESRGIFYIPFETFYELLWDLRRILRICKATVRRVSRLKRRARFLVRTATFIRKKFMALPSTRIFARLGTSAHLRYTRWKLFRNRRRIEHSIRRASRLLGRDVRPVISKFF